MPTSMPATDLVPPSSEPPLPVTHSRPSVALASASSETLPGLGARNMYPGQANFPLGDEPTVGNTRRPMHHTSPLNSRKIGSVTVSPEQIESYFEM